MKISYAEVRISRSVSMCPFNFEISADSRRAVVSYWRKYVHEVLVNRLGGLSLPRLTDRPDMTLDVYRGRKTTIQYNQLRDNESQLYFFQCITPVSIDIRSGRIVLVKLKQSCKITLPRNSKFTSRVNLHVIIFFKNIRIGFCMHKHVHAEIYTVQTVVWKTGLQVFIKKDRSFRLPCTLRACAARSTLCPKEFKLRRSEHGECLAQTAQSGLRLRSSHISKGFSSFFLL